MYLSKENKQKHPPITPKTITEPTPQLPPPPLSFQQSLRSSINIWKQLFRVMTIRNYYSSNPSPFISAPFLACNINLIDGSMRPSKECAR